MFMIISSWEKVIILFVMFWTEIYFITNYKHFVLVSRSHPWKYFTFYKLVTFAILTSKVKHLVFGSVPGSSLCKGLCLLSNILGRAGHTFASDRQEQAVYVPFELQLQAPMLMPTWPLSLFPQRGLGGYLMDRLRSPGSL